MLVFSSSSNRSPQVMREVERAVHHAIPIIPMRVEDVPMSKNMEFFISAPHWLDALTPPLEKHLDHVARSVEALLQRRPSRSAEGTPAPARPDAPLPVSPELSPARRKGMPTAALAGAAVALVLIALAAPALFSGGKTDPDVRGT